jgi:protein-tyrosine phosphatase
MRSRDLAWGGCLNVRDLGGHPTRDGGEIRFGAVVRADSIRQLSDTGWRALVDYGVRTVLDLRGDHERAEDPPAELPVEVVHVPFMEASESEWAALEPEFERIKQRTSAGPARTRDVYLLFLEHFRSNVGASVRAVARAPEGGVVIHCVGGKDRTGLLVALLLHVAGVAVEEIAADYALSEERLRPREAEWLSRAETDAERAEIRQISRTPAEAMAGVFEELERRYGTVERYLAAAGVEEADLEHVRGRLRG